MSLKRRWRNTMATLAVVAGLMLVMWPAGAQVQGGGWEWQNPLPQGNTLSGVWGNSGSDVFAVGEGGTILHYDGESWSAMSSGTTNWLNSVWGSSGGDAFDGIVGDSQWLGQGVTQGHYVDMTDLMVGEGIGDTVTEATLTYYGEYPTGSGRYWGFPTEGDALGWAYRMDLFEDPDEMAAFEVEYGYPLAVPETYDHLRDIAQFFTRPGDGLYGVAIYTQRDYDAITMGVENTFFTFGADWKDPVTNEVIGTVNSEKAVEALQMYRELYDCCQVPGLSDASFNETNQAFINGQAVMAMNYFAFFPALADPAISPYAASTGFFPNPKGPYGDQAAAMGGQGLSIVAHVSPAQQEAMKDFIRWFAREDIQAEWAALGGYTCNEAVLQTEEFLNATPFNPAFADTMTFVKDFWNIPEYAQLLEITQRELSTYVVDGEGTAQEALDTIAEEHDAILRDAGYITKAPAPAAQPEPDTSGVEEINILWAQWDPADYLQVIGNMYEAETGIKVNIVQEPWGTFYDRAFTEFTAGDVFAVGEGGTILHYDETGWSAMSSGTGYELNGVWGSSGSDIFVVGEDGTILHYEIGPFTFSTKTVNRPAALPGDPLTYTLTLNNGEVTDFTDVRVTDALPVSLTYIDDSLTATSGSYGYSSGVITWTGAVDALQVVAITFGAVVSQTAPQGTSITNSAVISGGGEIITRTATVHVVTPIYLPLVLKSGG